jgi:hypothetical protein
MLYQLLDTEGLYVGASSALNVVAAVELAQKLGKGKHINHVRLSKLKLKSIRLQSCDCVVRWCISIPEPTILQEMVRGEGAERCYTRKPEEVRGSRLVWTLADCFGGHSNI